MQPASCSISLAQKSKTSKTTGSNHVGPTRWQVLGGCVRRIFELGYLGSDRGLAKATLSTFSGGRMQNIQKFSWAELANVASKPGVYAWYYSPQITRFDLTKIIEEVQVLMSADKADDARLKIEQFLDIHLFRYFKEAPFLAKISGSLKPSYEGELEHNFLVSDSLVERLQERPERLHLIAEVIEFSAPHFASPIYIGFSDNLQVRIGQHRALIERFRRGTSGWHEG